MYLDISIIMLIALHNMDHDLATGYNTTPAFQLSYKTCELQSTVAANLT